MHFYQFFTYKAKSIWVIPLTYCAFQLILRPWIGKLTTSNCPFLQTIWNGLFHLVRLVVTQELYMNRKKVFWKEEISLICIQEHKNSPFFEGLFISSKKTVGPTKSSSFPWKDPPPTLWIFLMSLVANSQQPTHIFSVIVHWLQSFLLREKR